MTSGTSSVRVVARIRPLLPNEHAKDIIVTSAPPAAGSPASVVRCPNPRNPAELYKFNFQSVFDAEATQQDLFDNEVAPCVKHLYAGFDITIFAYGVTGTGKTHTMRGGKSLQDRGVIPRMLSAIYRRGRKLEKDSAGEKRIEVSMSYYEIYCDKVFDLFEPPEKRTLAGLPIRDNNGKTVVAGLTERRCESLKEFEGLYDEANRNRSTGATKLNAHSSRSHAILCVKLSQIEGDKVVTSTASAIDLAGSEDNRRTENGKERLVESSAINKSLFVLAQCVEAISKKQSRIPFRESKMTRILALGQNNGLTLMILNLAPVRSYHLDTLSSLNFANRTKSIEVNDVENEVQYMSKGVFRKDHDSSSAINKSRLFDDSERPKTMLSRRPLQPLAAAINVNTAAVKPTSGPTLKDKPMKAFSVYSEKAAPSRPSYGRKRPSEENLHFDGRQVKHIRASVNHPQPRNNSITTDNISRADLESLVNRMVEEKLAERTIDAPAPATASLAVDVQRRLEALEQRVQSQSKEDDARTEGLQYLLMAKQHQARSEFSSALKMYELAVPFFPGNEKLKSKMAALQDKIDAVRQEDDDSAMAARPKMARLDTAPAVLTKRAEAVPPKKLMRFHRDEEETRDDCHSPPRPHDQDESYVEPPQGPGSDEEYQSDASFRIKTKATKPRPKPKSRISPLSTTSAPVAYPQDLPPTPRTRQLLSVINSRSFSAIKSLRGVGAKKAEGIVNSLLESDGFVTSLHMLADVKGVGMKSVEKMREGIVIGGNEDVEKEDELDYGGGSGKDMFWVGVVA